MRRMICICVSITALLIGASACHKSSWDLDKMLDAGKYDEVIENANEVLKTNPKDYGTIIILGDAYFLKAKKFNMEAGSHYTPEGAALAKKAIDYYKEADRLNPSQRVQQKISQAGVLMSP